MNKAFQYVLRLGVSCGILFILLKVVPYQQVSAVIRSVHPGLLGVVIVLGGVTHVLGMFRWHCLLSGRGVCVQKRDIFFALMSGLFFNLFFPSFIASDVFRSAAVSSQRIPSGKAIASVIVDRFSGMTGMAIVVVISFLIGSLYLPFIALLFPMLLFIGITVFGLCIVFSKRCFFLSISIFRWHKGITRKLHTWHEDLYGFKESPGSFMVAVGYSVGIQIINIVMCYLLFIAFGQHVVFTDVWVVLPVVTVLATIPISVSGIGTREAAMVYFFGLVGVRNDVSLAVSLLSLVFMIGIGLIGGIIYVFYYHRRLQSYKNMA